MNNDAYNVLTRMGFLSNNYISEDTREKIEFFCLTDSRIQLFYNRYSKTKSTSSLVSMWKRLVEIMKEYTINDLILQEDSCYCASCFTAKQKSEFNEVVIRNEEKEYVCNSCIRRALISREDSLVEKIEAFK